MKKVSGEVKKMSLLLSFVLRDLEKNYGHRDFSFTDVQDSYASFGNTHPNIVQIAKSRGLINHVSRGRYRISKKGFNLIRTAQRYIL